MFRHSLYSRRLDIWPLDATLLYILVKDLPYQDQLIPHYRPETCFSERSNDKCLGFQKCCNLIFLFVRLGIAKSHVWRMSLKSAFGDPFVRFWKNSGIVLSKESWLPIQKLTQMAKAEATPKTWTKSVRAPVHLIFHLYTSDNALGMHFQYGYGSAI